MVKPLPADSAQVAEWPRTYVIIPALNEEDAIRQVVADLPDWVSEVVVVSNGSTDQTEARAAAAGATVLREPTRGYGHACLHGMAYLAAKPAGQQPQIIVFIDGDYSDYPEELPELVRPIIESGMDMVIGSRALGDRKPGSMMPQQIFGNWLATTLIRLFYGVRFTDLGPFRAIRWDKLRAMGMRDPTYGWTVEMQVRAAKQGLRSVEVPVRYRPRIGVSKVTGTLKGTVMAGYKILWTIFKLL